jgi:hypothetical protein
VKNKVCATIEDGRVSEQDRDILVGVLAAAEAAGLPAEFLTPLNAITGAGDQLPSESVDDLLAACGVGATPAPN